MEQVVVFDLDDTLYNEIDYLKSAFHEIAEFVETEYCISGVYAFMKQTYRQEKNVFEAINQKYSLDIPVSKYLSIYRNHIPNIQLDNTTKNVLETLQKSGCILGIVTDGREITQMNKIKALGLESFFEKENIIISETFGTEKPSLENYSYFQQKYSDSKFYYIGNNTEKDFIAPNKLGWTTVCILDNSKHIHKQDFTLPKEYLPKYNLLNIREILSLIY